MSVAMDAVVYRLAVVSFRVVGGRVSAVSKAPPDATLEEQMARLADGDRSAFRPVFEQLWEPTLRFCTRLLAIEADAADAAQQAMEKVFVRASDYESGRPVLPWALAIASWECRTIRTKRSRRREAPFAFVPESSTGDVVAAQAEQKELVEAAIFALDSLEASDRATLVATFLEEATNVHGATLRKRRQRALVRLREAFRRLYGLD